jgi:ADP-ribose pyrophosphatase YjhB (NUDIX family)
MFMITCTFEKGFTDNLRHVVVHALVVRENEILLEKRAGDLLESGKWAIPGGFLSLDETTQEGVLRELYEETGWKGEIVSLFRINSRPARKNDANRQNIVFEYIIKPTTHTGKTDWETSKVEWIPFNTLLPFDEYAFDHGDSIKLLLSYLKKPFPLPIII